MWDTTGLWVLLGFCCAVGVVGATCVRHRAASRPRARQAPLLFIGAWIDTLMTGLGIGMAVALVVLIFAAVIRALGV